MRSRALIISLVTAAIGFSASCGESTEAPLQHGPQFAIVYHGTEVDGKPIPVTVVALDGSDTVSALLGSVELSMAGEGVLEATSWSMSIGGPHPYASYDYTSRPPSIIGLDSVEVYLTGVQPTLVGRFDDTVLVLRPPGGVTLPAAPVNDIGKHAWRLRAVVCAGCP